MTEYIKKEDLVKWIRENETREYGDTGIREYGEIDSDTLLQYIDKASVDGELIKGRCKTCNGTGLINDSYISEPDASGNRSGGTGQKQCPDCKPQEG